MTKAKQVRLEDRRWGRELSELRGGGGAPPPRLQDLLGDAEDGV